MAFGQGVTVEFFLIACGVIVCVALFMKGYLVSMIVGGVVGSFFGVAGFGGAVSGMIPGLILKVPVTSKGRF